MEVATKIIERSQISCAQFSQLWAFDNGLCMSVVDLAFSGWEIALGWTNENNTRFGWDWAHDRPNWPILAEYLATRFPDHFEALDGFTECIVRISGIQEARGMAEALESLSKADLDRAFEDARK